MNLESTAEASGWWEWSSVTMFDDATLRKAARNRQTVVLVTGERVTLLSWGNSGGARRARVQWANGRQRTLKQAEIKGLVCDQLHS